MPIVKCKNCGYLNPVKAGTPDWMLTFGDMNSLLLTFFVLLITMSTFDIKKFELVISSFKNTFGVLEGGMTVSSKKLSDLGLHPEDLAEEVAQKLITFSENEASIILEQLAFKEDKVAKSGIEIKEDERGLIIQIAAPLLFDGGSHSIKPSAEKLLSKICRILRTVEGLNNRPLRIEGHADYIKFAGSNSNWELSVWRSISVLRYMIYEGIDRNRLSAVGYGDTKTLPRKPNEPDYEWNQRNRRVEIVVLREKTKK